MPMDFHLTLRPRGDRLWGVTEIPFSQRSATAMVELHPAPNSGTAAPRGGTRGNQ
jgi:hypothetical protein